MISDSKDGIITYRIMECADKTMGSENDVINYLSLHDSFSSFCPPIVLSTHSMILYVMILSLLSEIMRLLPTPYQPPNSGCSQTN